MPLILENICKSFTTHRLKDFIFRRGKPVPILKNISLTAHPGEVLALLGPNGAGKTTLLKIIASLIEPDSGRAMIDEININAEPLRAKRRIGLVNTNDRSFYWRLSLSQNLEFFASLHNLNGKKGAERIKKCLKIVGLTTKKQVKFATLSAGQRQKLAIARALLGENDILLFDEPTNSLDPTSSKTLLTFVREELVDKQQKTVIWCSHLLQDAEQISDRFAFLHHGEIIHIGRKEALQDSLAIKPVTTLVTGQPITTTPEMKAEIIQSKVKKDKYHTQVKVDEAQIPLMLAHLQSERIDVFACHSSKQNIAEIFDHLFAGQEP